MAAPAVKTLPIPVPVLSAKQKKIALKKTKKVNRNLLVKPYDDYWPKLNPQENDRMAEAFHRIMEAEKSLATIKLEEKELRALKRKKWSKDLVFGINDVPRCVMKGSVIAVLIADDINPKHLVQHVATLCGAAGVPVLIMSSLRKYTRQLLGFSSIAIGIKKIVAESEDNSLYEIHGLIKEISENYKPQWSIRQFNNTAEESDSSENETSVPAQEPPAVVEMQTAPSTDLYLYRTSCKSRVFVPESRKVESETPKVVSKEKQSLGDFVSLGDSDSDEFMETDTPVRGISYTLQNPVQKPKPKQTTPSFVPFKYVKVKPNPNKKPR